MANTTNKDDIFSSVGLGHGFEIENICRSVEFVARHVIGPVAEATILAYFKNCTPEFKPFLPDPWFLCTPEHDFNCEPLQKFTRQCKAQGEAGDHTTVNPEVSEDIMREGTGVLLLLTSLILGVLLGVVSTIIVCVLCPNTHKWTLAKLQSCKPSAKNDRKCLCSEHYAAVDEQKDCVDLKPQVSNEDHSQRIQFRRACKDGDMNNTPALITMSHNPGSQFDTSGNGAISVYETVSNGCTRSQSHKYADIGPVSPLSTTSESEHAYFVLQKTS